MPSSRPSNVWFTVDTMSSARIYHTSTLISQDNSVFIAGGSNGPTAVMSTDKYIPSTGCFQRMGNMPRARELHTADQLPSLSGYVLLAGGRGIGGSLIFADLFHPMTSDTLTLSLPAPRRQHVSAILSPSKLVLIGGYNQTSVVDSGDQLSVGSTSTFATANDTLPRPCYGHTVTRFGNNSDIALIAGGIDNAGGYLTSASLYQASSNAFIALPIGVLLPGGRGHHTATYLPPPIHKILIIGGVGYYITYATMALFDINFLSFTLLNNTLISPRYYHTATLLPNGKVLVAGGFGTSALRACEVIDPFNNYSSTPVTPLNTNRYRHTATFIPDDKNGTVLVCGGYDGTTYFSSCELYYV